MPMVGTCSAAISAACHRHEKDMNAHFMPLRWGFVPDAPGKKVVCQKDLKASFALRRL